MQCLVILIERSMMKNHKKKNTQQISVASGDSFSQTSMGVGGTPALPEAFVAIRDTLSNPVKKKCMNDIPTPGVIFHTESSMTRIEEENSSVYMSSQQHSPKEAKAKKIQDHNVIQPKADSPDVSSLQIEEKFDLAAALANDPQMKAFMERKFREFQHEYRTEQNSINNAKTTTGAPVLQASTSHQSQSSTQAADSNQGGVQQPASFNKIQSGNKNKESIADSQSSAFNLNPGITLKMNSQPFVPTVTTVKGKTMYMPPHMVESSMPFIHPNYNQFKQYLPQSKPQYMMYQGSHIQQPMQKHQQNYSSSENNSQSSMSNSSSTRSYPQQASMGESMNCIRDPTNPSVRIQPAKLQYATHYNDVIESLYFEQGDGEIFIAEDSQGMRRMVTCVDISSLYRGKRGKALLLMEQLASFKHSSITAILKYWVIQDKMIFIEMEEPKVLSQWKSFPKKKFNTLELLDVFEQVVTAVNFLHQNGYTHRDVHPSRIQQFSGDVVKFNIVGLPYNFKKLLKRDDFSGHINYSAPELILEKSDFTDKVDIWSLGCCLFYMIYKRDPFDGRDPEAVKRNILNFNLQEMQAKSKTSADEACDPMVFTPLMQACFNFEDTLRPSCLQLLQSISQIRSSLLKRTEINITKIDKLFDKSQLKLGSKTADDLEAEIGLLEKLDKSGKSSLMLPDQSSIYTFEDVSMESLRGQAQASPNFVKMFEEDTSRYYEGEMKDGMKEGYGTQLLENGDRYEGQWHQDMKHGFGQLTFSGSDVYTGHFSQGREHGQGKKVFSCGDIYTGEWRNGKGTGQGCYQFADGRYFQGQVWNCEPYGFGQLTGKGFEYIGDFKEGEFDGFGKLGDMSGIYEGQFKQSNKHGTGRFIDCNKTLRYDGMWEKDQKNGAGKLTNFLKNQVIQGIWENNQIVEVSSTSLITHETYESIETIQSKKRKE